MKEIHMSADEISASNSQPKEEQRTLSTVMIVSSESDQDDDQQMQQQIIPPIKKTSQVTFVKINDDDDEMLSESRSPSEEQTKKPTLRDTEKETQSLLKNKNNSCFLFISMFVVGLITFSIGISSLFKDSATYLDNKLGSGAIIVIGAVLAIIGLVLLLIRDRKLNAHVNRSSYESIATHDDTKLNENADNEFLQYSDDDQPDQSQLNKI